jgi:hypothetical protein
MSLNVTTAAGLSAIDLSSMDIETALMAVQTQRATLLEDQLKDQMKAVQARNKVIETMNTLLAAVRDQRPTGESTAEGDTRNYGQVQIPYEDYLPNQQAYVAELKADKESLEAELATLTDDEARAAKIIEVNDATELFEDASSNLEDALAAGPGTGIGINLSSALTLYGFKSGEMDQGEFDGLINNITSRIDSLNSSQQMDMLRLQSVTNKRNEAFDIMTNFIKKMQDSRSSIVGNMR